MKKVLKTQPAPKMSERLLDTASYRADDATRKSPQIKDRGLGSSFVMAESKEKSNQIRDQRKIKGNIGYTTNLGMKTEVAANANDKKKKIL